MNQRISEDIGKNFVQGHESAPFGVMGFRIMTTRAVMRAALREQDVAQSWTVHDGFADTPGDAQCDVVQCLLCHAMGMAFP